MRQKEREKKEKAGQKVRKHNCLSRIRTVGMSAISTD